MVHSEEVSALIRAGKFSGALKALGVASRREHSAKTELAVLQAHALERTGNYGQSQVLCEQLLKNKGLTNNQRSICETTLGVIKHDTANAAAGIVHFQRAVSLAQSAKDIRQVCWSQLRLMLALTDRTGPHSSVSVLTQLRANCVRLGDAQVSAALHIFLGEMEARRGLVQNGRRHTRLGLRLLNESPNLWLEARAENTLLALCIMGSDVVQGLHHAQRALVLAEESGAAGLRRACLGNFGNLCYLRGEFERAADYYERANSVLLPGGTRSNAALDSLARMQLRQGHFAEAEACLERIRQSIRTPNDALLHANRHSELTRSELLYRQGSFEAALKAVESGEGLAVGAGDHPLHATLLLQRAEILIRVGVCSEAIAILTDVAGDFHNHGPDVHARYERVLASIPAAFISEEARRFHRDRARRIYLGIQNVPGLLDLSDSISRYEIDQGVVHQSTSITLASRSATAFQAASILQDVAAFLMHAGRPELLATGLLAILAGSGAVVSATARSRADDGTTETLGTFVLEAPADALAERCISIGAARNRSFEVTLRPRADVESIVTVNAVTLLLGTVRDLERAHAEREERQTLWPIEEPSLDDFDAVVAGEMKKLLDEARKIAPANVSVLITGESGTGKEILARAIHRFSSRADKPFIPFNSAAIPKEMLESQLFGHRRGAFTGADRDNPGLIRAAKDGTLFLDEIGELGLELQPKLLRFLESGEINPLGESAPLTVDVRIIAATNSNLERLVEDGRFRDDLFYRLNVIRLTISPLRERRDEIPGLVHHFVRRFAAEYGKGEVRVAEETMEHLLLFEWPGNVRQLGNELRRMVALAENDSILTPASLSIPIRRPTPPAAARADGPAIAVPLHDKLMPTLSRIEREMIRVALSSNHGRTEAAARALGISRKGLYLKRQRLGL